MTVAKHQRTGVEAMRKLTKGTLLVHATKRFYVKLTAVSSTKVSAMSKSKPLTFDRKKMEWMIGKGVFEYAAMR